jgi:hypothetical protein
VKHKILIITFLFTLLSQRVFTQIYFRSGPEFGISVTSKPIISENKYSHLVSPLFGYSGLLIINNRFILTTGLQYERTGYRKEWNITGIEEVETIEFQKVCIPMTVGLTFKVLRISPSFFIGYRPNLLLSGKKETYIKTFDLFYDGSKAKRYINQFTIGLSLEVLNALRVNLYCCTGQAIEYSIPYYLSSGHMTGRWVDFGGSFKFSEYSLSLTYLFKSKRDL